jgi:poly(3-hydroxybutyrate) depolymerase
MCTAEDIFAAVAPMCGTSFVDLEMNCMLDRPVSLMLRIGRQDGLNCWEGTNTARDTWAFLKRFYKP